MNYVHHHWGTLNTTRAQDTRPGGDRKQKAKGFEPGVVFTSNTVRAVYQLPSVFSTLGGSL